MSTITIGVILLVLAIFGALWLAGRSARRFTQEKKKRQHQHQAVRLPPAPHGRRAKKK